MATIISRRKLEPGGFDNWESRFASAADARKQAGCRGIRRFRSVEDPNEVVVIFDWDSHENAPLYRRQREKDSRDESRRACAGNADDLCG